MKTYAEINEKILKGTAVVVTAEEIIDIVEQDGIEKAAKEIDVVTTATFGPMCSSGCFLNLGHTNPRMKITKAWINGVNVYAGLAAVDLYLGCTEIADDDPANRSYPGEFAYGGGHIIQELVEGKEVDLKATAYGTDCYPRKELHTKFTLNDINEAVLVNPRNCYQNYGVAVNPSDKTIHTYMGILKPKLGNANYCSAGQLSPLLNDPLYKTIGIGTRIWLAGAQGYVYWQGTQHNPNVKRNDRDVPIGGAGTLAVVGDLKKMDARFLRGTSMRGYGTTLTVGMGVPIPMLSEEICRFVSISDEEIQAPIIDYSDCYPNMKPSPYGSVSYQELRSGHITVDGKKVPTAGLSSYFMARRIADKLKKEISEGEFLLSQAVQPLPGKGSDTAFKPFKAGGAKK
jgi:uncharacterized protein (DUF39 family)